MWNVHIPIFREYEWVFRFLIQHCVRHTADIPATYICFIELNLITLFVLICVKYRVFRHLKATTYFLRATVIQSLQWPLYTLSWSVDISIVRHCLRKSKRKVNVRNNEPTQFSPESLVLFADGQLLGVQNVQNLLWRPKKK